MLPQEQIEKCDAAKHGLEFPSIVNYSPEQQVCRIYEPEVASTNQLFYALKEQVLCQSVSTWKISVPCKIKNPKPRK